MTNVNNKPFNYSGYSSIKRLFTVSIVMLTTASILALGLMLYESNTIKYSSDVNSSELQQLVADNPELVEYLQSEHQNEAHFLKISSLVQQNQQRELGRLIVYLTLPVIAISGLIGYLLSKKLLSPVEEAQASQDRFIQDAGHELRNPLATMQAVLDNAEQEKSITANKYKNLIVSLKRQVKRLVNINEDLIYLERYVVEDKLSKINVSELLLDVIEDMQTQATEKNIRFKTEIEPNIYLIINTKDFVKLTKNIIENAIKYSKKSSKTITVQLNRSKSKVILSVADRGVGIPEDQLDKITERFFRAKNVNSYEGTGLGLSIVKKVAERYGAKLTINSKLGKGTSVQIEFK